MRGSLSFDNEASIGVGALIIFISMIMVAGVTASVFIQTMNSLQQQALTTGAETIRDISSGVKITHASGYKDGSIISQLALFVKTISGSEGIDLANTFISISDGSTQSVLNYNNNAYSSSVSNGIFQTLNSSNLTSSTYGIIVIRDVDGSCKSDSPTINSDDSVALMVNTTVCFSGISTRTDVSGRITPEKGISGLIGFTTPSAYTRTIIDLYP
jgi:flagellin FlaB